MLLVSAYLSECQYQHTIANQGFLISGKTVAKESPASFLLKIPRKNDDWIICGVDSLQNAYSGFVGYNALIWFSCLYGKN